MRVIEGRKGMGEGREGRLVRKGRGSLMDRREGEG